MKHTSCRSGITAAVSLGSIILFLASMVVGTSIGYAADTQVPVAEIAIAEPVACSVPARAPAVNLPPGAVVVMEVHLTDDNILSAAKQMIPSVVEGGTSAVLDMATNARLAKSADLRRVASALEASALSRPDDLYAALGSLRAVRVVVFKPAVDAGTEGAMGFFESQFRPEQGWDRMLYLPIKAMAIYTRADEMSGVILAPMQGINVTFSTLGRVDVPKLMSWLTNAAVSAGIMYQFDLRLKPDMMPWMQPQRPATIAH